MKKLLKILIITVLTVVLLILSGLLILSSVHHQKANERLLSWINQQVEGEVYFSDFHFSYITSFPNIELEVSDIRLSEDNRDLMTSDKVEIKLNPVFLMQEEIKIQKIIIDGLELNSVIDSLGNKPVFFSSKNNAGKKKTEDESMKIDLNKISINNSRLFFSNGIKNNRSYIYISSGKFQLRTQDSLLIVTGNVYGSLDTLISNNTILFKEIEAEGKDVNLQINRFNGTKKLAEGVIQAGKLNLFPRFTMKPHRDGQLINLEIRGEENFNALLDLFEIFTDVDVEQVNPDAMLKLSYNQNGFVNPFERPYTEIDFEITEGKFSGEELPFPVIVSNVTGNYNNGEGHSPETVELVIDTINAEVEESFVNARFRLTDLKDPVIDAHFIAEVDLNHLIKPSEDLIINGKIEADLFVDGRLSEIRSLHLEGKQTAKGKIEIKDLEFQKIGEGYNLRRISGSSQINNHLVEVTSLVGAFNESVFSFSGLFHNLDLFLLRENKDLQGSFDFHFDKLDLRNLMEKSKTEPVERNLNNFSSLQGLDLGLSLTGNEILTDFGSISNIVFQSNLKGEKISIDTLQLTYLDGNIGGNGNIVLDSSRITEASGVIAMNYNKIDLVALIGQFSAKEMETSETKTSQRFPKVDFEVKIDAKEIMYHDLFLTNFYTGLQLSDEDLDIRELRTESPFGYLKMNVAVKNYPSSEISYSGNIEIVADELNMQKLLSAKALGFPELKKEEEVTIENNLTRMGLLRQNISVDLSLKANLMSYQNATIKDVNLQASYMPEKAELKNAEFSIADGNLKLYGYIRKDEKDHFPGYIKSTADSIDINLLFRYFNNFDQDVFTAENTRGNISWFSHHYFHLNEELVFVRDENTWLVNAFLHDARFDEVEPIEKALFFVNHEIKDHVKVQELDVNCFLFQDKLYFSDIKMTDNVTDLDIYGTIDLDDKEMDLGIEVSLTDIVAGSRMLQFLKSQTGGILGKKERKAHLHMFGPLDDRKIRLKSKKKFEKGRHKLLMDIKHAQQVYKAKHVKYNQQ